MGKGWAVFFGVVLTATLLLWLVAPFFGWWLPENVSSFGDGVDNLFYIILGFTGFFFVLTEIVMVYAMWTFAQREGEKSVYTHGNHRLEVLWTAVPAAILLFIAFAQVRAWEGIKYRSRMPEPELTVSVYARQWEWRMRYPSDPGAFMSTDSVDKNTMTARARFWAENPDADDIHIPNEIHCWQGANVKIWLRTQDVLHSFTIPNLRIKQDTLPGKTIPMWFQAVKANTEFDPVTKKCKEPDNKKDTWEIACQELCGGRHYAMRGRLYVHKTKESFLAWLKHARASQNQTQPDGAVAAGK